MYQYVLFDLDGTLTDPGLGITNSVMHALKKFDIEVEDRTTLYKFIGPPLAYGFAEFYGFSKEKAETAIGYFREYFSVKGLYENEVYDGIEDLLKELKAAGKHLIVATSKPEEFAKEILRHFKLDSYFDFIAGALMDETRTNKDEVIAYALESCGIKDVSDVIMVGDRKYDILGAKRFGMSSIGVSYGYGSREELEDAGATHIVENPVDIIKCV